jgi:hypothetical protein
MDSLQSRRQGGKDVISIRSDLFMAVNILLGYGTMSVNRTDLALTLYAFIQEVLSLNVDWNIGYSD